MNWAETFRAAGEAINSRRLRSGLTVLGILIGITAVMLTVGLGQGAQQKVAAQIDALGTNLLVVAPGSSTSSAGVRAGRGSATTLTTEDAQTLGNSQVAPDIAGVAATSSSQTSVVAGSNNWTTSIVGTTPSWLTVRARTMALGRFITANDVSQASSVAVIGTTTATNLFGARNPVGQAVTMAGQTFTIVGELTSVGTLSSVDQDDQVVMPGTTYADRLSTGSADSVSDIYLQASSSAHLSAAQQEATSALLTTHDVTTADEDFSISSQQALVATATSTTQTLTVLLAGIAGISMLVGGIGVMNIMLVSVTERIREIGLRKALGATPRTIRKQFLTEASLLGLAGGGLGIGLGVIGALTLPHFLNQPVSLSLQAAGLALVVSVLIGVGAGVYPASRAARLTPIEALRSE